MPRWPPEGPSSNGRPSGDSVYNPFARGGASEIADKALAGERFTEPHYLRQAQRYLGHVVRALRGAGTEVSLRAIVDHLDPGRLEMLVRALPEAEARATFAYLDSLSSRQQSELAGVRDRLAILAESDVGPWLDPQTAGAERFDLLTAVQASGRSSTSASSPTAGPCSHRCSARRSCRTCRRPWRHCREGRYRRWS